MKKLSWSRMPVLQITIWIHRNNYIFCDSHRHRRSPFNLCCWHRIEHIFIHNICSSTLLHIKNTDCTIKWTGSYQFVIWTETNAISGLFSIAQSIFVRYLHLWICRSSWSERMRKRYLILLLIWFCHHFWK